jgi:hypothetical protein
MRRIAIALVVVSLAVSGCNSSLPPEADPTRAREALKTTLDAWVQGGTFEDLKKGSPAIIAYDPDWETGSRLLKYEVDPTDRRVGVDLLVSVTLTLSKNGEKSREKRVNFSIAIGNGKTVVLRQT